MYVLNKVFLIISLDCIAVRWLFKHYYEFSDKTKFYPPCSMNKLFFVNDIFCFQMEPIINLENGKNVGFLGDIWSLFLEITKIK